MVPVSILAPHWNKLLAASVLDQSSGFKDGSVRIRKTGSLLLHSAGYAPEELAIFACDFGRLAPRAGLPAASSCPGAIRRRPRPVCESVADQADRVRLRDALLAARDGRWTSGAPPAPLV